LDEREPFFDRVERTSFEQVGRVDGVPGGTQFVPERGDAFSEPLDVVEQQYLGHVLRSFVTDGIP